MSTSQKATFTVSGRTENAVTTAAKTTYDDNTNAVKIADAGTNGSILTALHATPRATATASNLQLYVSPDNGTTMHLVETVLMEAHTVATDTAIPSTLFEKPSLTTPIFFENGSSLWVGAAVALADGVVFTGTVEDY